MATCWDSTTPGSILTVAPIVAGYIDGRFAWSAGDWLRLGASYHVPVTVEGTPGARACDIETGDLTPTQGAAWAVAEIAARRRPTLYCNKSTWAAVVGALHARGVSSSSVDFWIADPTGVPHVVPGSAVTQYAWNQLGQTGGLNVDLSATNGVWPGSIVPVSNRPATVAIVGVPGGGGYWEIGADGGVFAYGNAQFHGSLGGQKLTAPIVAASAVGAGYVLAGADGAIYAFNCGYFGGSNQ